ncbi:MAG: LOG family protein [Bacteroidales bacterium]|nr:LOG family protein [Bacteroidales bacterium]
MEYKEIESEKELKKILKEAGGIINKTAFQNVDLQNCEESVLKYYFSNCIFLGCNMNDEIKEHIEKENFIFPKLDVPYNVYPNSLYTKNDLYGAYITGKPATYENTFDKLVYNHFIETGKEADSIKETLARRLHDHSISDALYDFLDKYDEKKVIAIMGGHSLPRNTEDYKKVVNLSKKLTENGYLMTSGGGPGAMEATHVGAWFAGRAFEELEDAFSILDQAPLYKDKLWMDTAMQVIDKYPDMKEYESLGIPTWLYGHEPPTPFATKIAKYFANSVREDGLLTIAKGGIIFSPGSAGTIQEVFQEITQNHYLSFGYASPMIFMNKQFWTEETPVYTYIEDLVSRGKLKNLILSVCNTIDEIKTELDKFS